MRQVNTVVLVPIVCMCLALVDAGTLHAQTLRWETSADSSTWVQLNVLAQPWLRYDQSNEGSQRNGEPVDATFDIGMRRARIVLQAQVTPRAFLFVQYGLNNFNSMSSTGGNRKTQAFFHDVFGEYRLTEHNELKLGAGLTILNGLSRFSQPGVTSIMTTDVPVFAQATVDQIDEFSRKFSVTARGQIGPIDYRFALSDPFPITSTGSTPPALGPDATFTTYGHSLQQQAYVIWQFLDHEPHTTPYMTGTYLGTRSVLNVAMGAIHQPNATWRTTTQGDTILENMTLWAVESFYDAPIDSDGRALSAYVGAFFYDYGQNYLRYNGIMNPVNNGSSYGNAFPMFGTGTAIYAQLGIFLPNVIGHIGLLPYVSIMSAAWDSLDSRMNVVNAGTSFLLDGQKSKVSLDVQNRPDQSTRKTQVVVQYQLFL